MKITRNALLIGLAIAALGLSATASAHDRHDHRHWKHGHHHKHGHVRHYERHYGRHVGGTYYAPPYVVRERVVVHHPVYVAPPPRYYAPAYPPGVVVRVDIPPIVIPIR